MSQRKTISLEEHERIAKAVSAAVQALGIVSGAVTAAVPKKSTLLKGARRTYHDACRLWHDLENLYYREHAQAAEEAGPSPYRRVLDELNTGS